MKHLNDTLQESRKRIAHDFEALLCDAEGLVQAVAGVTGESARDARDRIQEHVDSLRRTLVDGQKSVVGGARTAVRSADDYVHANPWPAIGAALAAGIVI